MSEYKTKIITSYEVLYIVTSHNKQSVDNTFVKGKKDITLGTIAKNNGTQTLDITNYTSTNKLYLLTVKGNSNTVSWKYIGYLSRASGNNTSLTESIKSGYSVTISGLTITVTNISSTYDMPTTVCLIEI